MVNSQTKIKNGKFYFKHSISYPLGFRLLIKINSEIKYASDVFIVDSGVQNIVCNIDSLRESPHIRNKSMDELKNNYLNTSSSGVINSDSFLLQYTLKNPDSYVALWKLIYKFSDGYKIIYDSNL